MSFRRCFSWSHRTRLMFFPLGKAVCAMLGRAVYELGYELHHRPDWVRIPLQGILQLLGPGPAPPPEDNDGDGQRP